jgi:hypothetical protein
VSGGLRLRLRLRQGARWRCAAGAWAWCPPGLAGSSCATSAATAPALPATPAPSPPASSAPRPGAPLLHRQRGVHESLLAARRHEGQQRLGVQRRGAADDQPPRQQGGPVGLGDDALGQALEQVLQGGGERAAGAAPERKAASAGRGSLGRRASGGERRATRAAAAAAAAAQRSGGRSRCALPRAARGPASARARPPARPCCRRCPPAGRIRRCGTRSRA